MMAEITLNDREIQDAMDYFQDWIGFKLTREQFMEILDSEPDLKSDIAGGGADTVSREWFMNVLAQRITGDDWPTFSDSKEKTAEFYKAMKENGQKMGYAIPDNY